MAPRAHILLQDSFNPKGDYGLSDFDARNHFVFSGTWNLPFHGNRLVEGWLLANITQLQSGNPMNVVTTSTYNGVTSSPGTIRPTLIGPYPPDAAQPWPMETFRLSEARPALLSMWPVVPSTPNLPALATCTATHLPGPASQTLTYRSRRPRGITERTALVLRIDAFDLLNHANFANPTLAATGAATSTFGQISATRTAVGDAGSSRQLQFAMRFEF